MSYELIEKCDRHGEHECYIVFDPAVPSVFGQGVTAAEARRSAYLQTAIQTTGRETSARPAAKGTRVNWRAK